MLGWLACSLLACTLAYSFVTILHQAWGTRWGGSPPGVRVTAWREGATLAGVLLASVLPAWLGLDATTGFLALGLALGLTGLLRLKTRFHNNNRRSP
jgi:Na+/melibiose symporter-like transporter